MRTAAMLQEHLEIRQLQTTLVRLQHVSQTQAVDRDQQHQRVNRLGIRQYGKLAEGQREQQTTQACPTE
jgi:hypothetical protein